MLHNLPRHASAFVPSPNCSPGCVQCEDCHGLSLGASGCTRGVSAGRAGRSHGAMPGVSSVAGAREDTPGVSASSAQQSQAAILPSREGSAALGPQQGCTLSVGATAVRSCGCSPSGEMPCSSVNGSHWTSGGRHGCAGQVQCRGSGRRGQGCASSPGWTRLRGSSTLARVQLCSILSALRWLLMCWLASSELLVVGACSRRRVACWPRKVPDWWSLVPPPDGRRIRRERTSLLASPQACAPIIWNPLQWALPPNPMDVVRWRRRRVVHRSSSRRRTRRLSWRLVRHQCGLLGVRVGEASHPGPATSSCSRCRACLACGVDGDALPGQDFCATHQPARGVSRGGGSGPYGDVDGDVPLARRPHRCASVHTRAVAPPPSPASPLRRYADEGLHASESSCARPAQLRRLNEQGDSMPGSQQSGAADSDSLADIEGTPPDSQQSTVQGTQDSVLADQAASALTIAPSAPQPPLHTAATLPPPPSPPSGALPPRRMHCPIPSCPAADHTRHAGWTSMVGLRAHLQEHASGRLSGDVPSHALDEMNLGICRVCSRLLSRRFGDACPKCRPALAQPATAPSTSRPIPPEYPAIREVCTSNVITRRFVPSGAKS